MAISRSQWEAMLKRLEANTRQAVLQAIATAKTRAQIEAVVEAVIAGDLDTIVYAAGVREGMWSNLNEQIRAAYLESGVLVMNADLPRGLSLDFNITNPRAEHWLRTKAAERVVDLKDGQYAAVREVLQHGMARGNNPRTIALDIVGRIGPTGRRQGGILGLTDYQSSIVNKMKDDLDELNYARYKTRKLRDKRFDKLVKRFAEEGKPIPAKTKAKIVGRYEDRWLKHRADTIARTETLEAVSAASDETLHQVVENGLAPRHAALRIWRHSYSKNEREGHVMMNDQIRGLDELFINPLTAAALMYPGDPAAGPGEVINCRCRVEHEIDFAAVERVA